MKCYVAGRLTSRAGADAIFDLCCGMGVDAIALAARTDAPISVVPEVLDEAGVEIRDEDEEDAVARFRSFLDSVDPGDFDQTGPSQPG